MARAGLSPSLVAAWVGQRLRGRLFASGAILDVEEKIRESGFGSYTSFVKVMLI
jgi:hypothetical protein